MNSTSGWEMEKELQASEVPGQENGRWVYRLSALGKLDDVNVLQNYYVVASPEGDQVVRTYFTDRRGVEALGSVWTFLDLTPLGRQERWEEHRTPPVRCCREEQPRWRSC